MAILAVLPASFPDALYADTAPATATARAVTSGHQHWFGVATENIPPAIARQLKLKKNQGLMVVQVLPNSPAAVARLQPDDLLTEVDGKPLSSQEDLARAANTIDESTGGMKLAKVTFLRDGDRLTVPLTPAPRPAHFQIVNPTQSFVPAAEGTTANTDAAMRTIVTSTGQQVNVGGGYIIALNSAEARRVNIGQLSKENVILTVATDEHGKKTNSITVGNKTYAVEKDKIDELPNDIRPLAEQLLKSDPQRMTQQRRARTTEDRLRELEEENKQLSEKLDRLIKLLEKK